MCPFESEPMDDNESNNRGTNAAVSGFVAMEYYAGILNRTFVIFVAREGLYGWKAAGPVPAGDPQYFLPLTKVLEDPKIMQDVVAVRELSKRKGGFFIPRSEIKSAEAIAKQKWGMGGIPHTGRILVHFVSGDRREFILLGRVDADRIRRAMLS